MDADVELQRGHVINDAFKGSSKKWVVQRKDVDSFFGANFEADFTTIQHFGKVSTYDIFSDKNLYAQFSPQVFFKGKLVKHYPFDPRRQLPPNSIIMDIPDRERIRKPFPIVVRDLDLEEVRANPSAWGIAFSKDARLAGCVSALKAAHLSLFSVLGYNYACSSGGILLGHDILGNFFKENKQLQKHTIQSNAAKYFSEFASMVRPMINPYTDFPGTLINGEVKFCGNLNGFPWGLIVIVKAGKHAFGVMMPSNFNGADIASYIEFMMNDREELFSSDGFFDIPNNQLRINPDRRPMLWPKVDQFITPVPDRLLPLPCLPTVSAQVAGS